MSELRKSAGFLPSESWVLFLTQSIQAVTFVLITLVSKCALILNHVI